MATCTCPYCTACPGKARENAAKARKRILSSIDTAWNNRASSSHTRTQAVTNELSDHRDALAKARLTTAEIRSELLGPGAVLVDPDLTIELAMRALGFHQDSTKRWIR